FNGLDLRLIETGTVHTRRFLDFHLDSAIEEAEGLATLGMMVRPASFLRDRSARSWIDDLVRDSERHAFAVCASLRQGVLAASTAIINALSNTAIADVEQSFEQSLTLVYRMLFLLFAEAR